MQKSARGKKISRYHVEAGIVAEHCLARSYQDTRWDVIVKSYELLEKITGSPIAQLNNAIAIAELEGPVAGLSVLESKQMPGSVTKSYYWYAVKADLLFRSGLLAEAESVCNHALESAPSAGIQNLLQTRFNTYRE